MQTLDAAISRTMTGLSRVLWEGVFWGGGEQRIIGYGDYTSKRSRGDDVEWFIVGLAAQKNYISVYVNAVEGDRYVAETFADKIGKAKVGKSSISFKHVDDIDLDTLLHLVSIAKDQMS